MKLTFSLILLFACVPAISGPVEFGRSELAQALATAGLSGLAITTELDIDLAETYEIERGRRGTIAVRGGDLRGVMYGLLDAAEQVRTTGKIVRSQGRPAMPIRGVRIFVHSESVEREHTSDYWLDFIRMLARNRFNRLNLVFAHQTSYLAPPYPFWVDVPAFPSVKARGLTEGQRRLNLEMLRFISQTAADHGIDFTLGIWEHNIQPGMQPSVDGLTPENIGAYSHEALKAVLQACPAIRGVQMRTNSESGIPADQQVAFYRDHIFPAIRDAGRLVNLEIRGWLMQKGLMDAALNAGAPLRLSSKYWAEDMGRPYQPAETWANYSFLNFLERTPPPVAEPSSGEPTLPMLDLFPKLPVRARPFDFYWEVWGLGSHRLLLWGDPDYVRRAVRTFTLSDTQGFEIDPPLAQRGFGNTEAFPIFLPEQKQRIFWRHDFERYWMFYLLWGRLSYAPEIRPQTWMTELERRFGATAAPQVLEAYRQASRVLSEIVAAHLADPNMYIWPEINPGGLIDAYADVRPSDQAYIAGIREAVRNRIEHRASAKQTPLETAALLQGTAKAIEAAIAKARSAARQDNAEWLSTERDFEVLAQLAEFHARKMTAAHDLISFYETGASAPLYAAKQQLSAALDTWKRIVELTDGVYPPGMSFAPDDKGHWKDKLPYVEHDVKLIDERIAVLEKYGVFERAFDFGGAIKPRCGPSYRDDAYLWSNTVEPRFTAVDPDTIYDEQKGYGWVTGEGRTATTLATASYLTVRAVKPNPADLPANCLEGDAIAGVGPHVFRVRTGEGTFRVLMVTPEGHLSESQAAARNGVVDVVFPEGPWRVSALILKRPGAEPPAPTSQRWPEPATRPAFEHTPPSVVTAGQPLTLSFRASPSRGVACIRLRYRPLNQLEKWRLVEAQGARASFTIPAEELSARHDLQYYFEVLHDGGAGWFYPEPRDATPYFVVRVQ